MEGSLTSMMQCSEPCECGQSADLHSFTLRMQYDKWEGYKDPATGERFRQGLRCCFHGCPFFLPVCCLPV